MTRVDEALAGSRVHSGLARSEYGDPRDERPALVVLHGLTFDRTIFQPALDHLARVDPQRRAIAFDLPGHGDSPAAASHRVDDLVACVHDAVVEAGAEAPVVVGHSMAAVVATLYASRHPVSGVVNVDQPLRIEPFAKLVDSLRDRLDSDAFPQVWQMFWASMGIDQLPGDAQERLRVAGRPRRELVLSYWRDLLDTPTHELAALMDDALAVIRAARTSYQLVLGQELETTDAQWLRERLPDATITVIPGSGHFPQLGDPQRFAQILRTTATFRPLRRRP